MTIEHEQLKSVAMAICRVQLNGGDPTRAAVRWNGTEMEVQDFEVWHDYVDEAVAALAAMGSSSHGEHCERLKMSQIAELEAEVERWNDLHSTIAQITGRGPNWPSHGNAPLAIAAGYQLMKIKTKAAEEKNAELETEIKILEGKAPPGVQSRLKMSRKLTAAEANMRAVEGLLEKWRNQLQEGTDHSRADELEAALRKQS